MQAKYFLEKQKKLIHCTTNSLVFCYQSKILSMRSPYSKIHNTSLKLCLVKSPSFCQLKIALVSLRSISKLLVVIITILYLLSRDVDQSRSKCFITIFALPNQQKAETGEQTSSQEQVAEVESLRNEESKTQN